MFRFTCVSLLLPWFYFSVCSERESPRITNAGFLQAKYSLKALMRSHVRYRKTQFKCKTAALTARHKSKIANTAQTLTTRTQNDSSIFTVLNRNTQKFQQTILWTKTTEFSRLTPRLAFSYCYFCTSTSTLIIIMSCQLLSWKSREVSSMIKLFYSWQRPRHIKKMCFIFQDVTGFGYKQSDKS